MLEVLWAAFLASPHQGVRGMQHGEAEVRLGRRPQAYEFELTLDVTPRRRRLLAQPALAVAWPF